MREFWSDVIKHAAEKIIWWFEISQARFQEWLDDQKGKNRCVSIARIVLLLCFENEIERENEWVVEVKIHTPKSFIEYSCSIEWNLSRREAFKLPDHIWFDFMEIRYKILIYRELFSKFVVSEKNER